MSKIRWTRWLVWTAVLGVLIVLGVGIHEAQPREPLWQYGQSTRTADEELVSIESVRFAPDSANVITYAVRREMAAALTPIVADVLEPATITVRDRTTGERLARYPKSGVFHSTPVFSSDLRYCVGHAYRKEKGEDEECILLIDLREERETYIPCAFYRGYSSFVFSPASDIVAHIPDEEHGLRPLSIYETATGKLLDSRFSLGLFDKSFSDDFLIHRAEGDKSTVELWNLTTRKPAGVLCKPGWVAHGLSRDRRALLLSKGQEDGLLIKGEWGRWELSSRKFTSGPAALSEFWGNPSPDGKWVGEWGSKRFHLREAATGVNKGSAEVPMDEKPPVYSPDGRFLLVPFSDNVSPPPMGGLITRLPQAESDALTVYAVPTMEVRWKQRFGDNCDDIGFGQVADIVYASFESDQAVQILDTETGDVRGTIDMQCRGATRFVWTPDHRFLLIRRHDHVGAAATQTLPQKAIEWLASFFPNPQPRSSGTIVVYDTVAKHERFRLTGWRCDDVWLSDDGTTLVTSQDMGSVIHCWHVGPKPLHWAIGIPAAIGAMLVTMAWGYGRWRRNRAD
jgi:hypothetical protein